MTVYAIIEAGSKQFRVEPNTVLEIEKQFLPENQKEVFLDKVLFLRDGEKIQVGTPWVAGAKILCDFLGNDRASKVISLKFRRRKASRRKIGHRQEFSKLLVKEIKMES
jgi:large subunit ribosomal protein L21